LKGLPHTKDRSQAKYKECKSAGTVQKAALLKVGVVSYFSKAALENRIKLAHFYPKLTGQIFNNGEDDYESS